MSKEKIETYLHEEKQTEDIKNNPGFVYQLMWLIAIFTVIIGFIVMVGAAGSTDGFLMFVGATIITISGVLMMGFAKVIALLTEIKHKL